MRQSGIIVHISGLENNKQGQFVNTLKNMLQDRGHTPSELAELQVKEHLAITDEELLVRAISWVSKLLVEAGMVVLVSVSSSLGQRLATWFDYNPNLEVTGEKTYVTSASEHLRITAWEEDLPQEIAQVLLMLEKMITTEGGNVRAKHTTEDDVYSPEEERLLQEHLRSLGYL